MKWVEKIKDNVDTGAVKMTVILLFMSWLAAPAIYYYIVRSKKEKEKKNEDVGQIR